MTIDASLIRPSASAVRMTAATLATSRRRINVAAKRSGRGGGRQGMGRAALERARFGERLGEDGFQPRRRPGAAGRARKGRCVRTLLFAVVDQLTVESRSGRIRVGARYPRGCRFVLLLVRPRGLASDYLGAPVIRALCFPSRAGRRPPLSSLGAAFFATMNVLPPMRRPLRYCVTTNAVEPGRAFGLAN
jgi:hypothetical protein